LRIAWDVSKNNNKKEDWWSGSSGLPNKWEALSLNPSHSSQKKLLIDARDTMVMETVPVVIQ
jgi:hypothetical protein